MAKTKRSKPKRSRRSKQPTAIRDAIMRSMKVQGISRHELAKLAGVSRTGVYEYLSGDGSRGVSSKTVERIVAALEVQIVPVG